MVDWWIGGLVIGEWFTRRRHSEGGDFAHKHRQVGRLYGALPPICVGFLHFFTFFERMAPSSLMNV